MVKYLHIHVLLSEFMLPAQNGYWTLENNTLPCYVFLFLEKLNLKANTGYKFWSKLL